MIWRSALNILAAWVRNLLQGNHQCIRLEHDEQFGWEWNCSCGHWDSLHKSELSAIRSFSRHVKHPNYKTWGSRVKERL